MTFTWENGRQLKSAAVGGQTVQFRYDTSGVRIGKTAGSTTWKYTVENGKVLYENNGSIAIRYYYDENGSPFAVYIGSAKYLYEKNLQGDIIGLIDENGQLAVKYTYDAWGKVTKTNVAGTTASTSAMTNNHLLYRGYYIDNETSLYYLGNRYYDPETGRFINADDVGNLGANGDFASMNLFVYCGNNPVGRIDDEGDIWSSGAKIAGKAAIGSTVNVVTSFVAAKATGQEYTFMDGLVAAGTGAVSGIIDTCEVRAACAVVTGIYKFYKTQSLGEALFAAGTTYFSSSNSISRIVEKQLDGIEISLAAKSTSNLVFGTGDKCLSESIWKGFKEINEGWFSQPSQPSVYNTISSGAAPAAKSSYRRERSSQKRFAPFAMVM